MQIKSELIKNASVSIGGNVIGQVIALAVYPVITRIYSEDQFGIFATYMGICAILTIIGTGRYEESIVIAEKNETAPIIGISLKWLAVFSFITFTATEIFHKQIFSMLNMEQLSSLRHYIPFSVFLAGCLHILNNLSIRNKKFKTIASATIIQYTANAATRLCFGWLSPTCAALAASGITSQIFAASAYIKFKKHIAKAVRGKWKDEKKAAMKYRDFPTFNLLKNLLNALSANLPLYAIGFFGAKETGLYSLALFALSTPIVKISGSLFSAFFEQFTARQKNSQPIKPIVKAYWKNLAIFVLPCFIIITAVAKPVFSFVFGQNWVESGTYFQLMSPWWFMVMATSPLQPIFIVFRKQHKILFAETIYLIIRTIALSVGIYFADLKIGVLAFSAAGVISTGIYAIWIHKTVSKYEKNIHKTIN
ncbi:MAG: oligosaccharide flippase family protein [Dysgonamonadaceae bacterium]|jgi:O-antigen/teichoic acid export membrane protein|nr:oligosaccharide flippase family protein [Dysgonamonadaceae bacterium]